MSFESRNPANGQLIETYEEMTPEDVSAILARGRDAFFIWRQTSFEERASLLKAAANELRQRRESLARLMAEEMGKPLAGGRAEINKCAWVCDYYAEHAAAFLEDEIVVSDSGKPKEPTPSACSPPPRSKASWPTSAA